MFFSVLSDGFDAPLSNWLMKPLVSPQIVASSTIVMPCARRAAFTFSPSSISDMGV
jgi:hypothetical protein